MPEEISLNERILKSMPKLSAQELIEMMGHKETSFSAIAARGEYQKRQNASLARRSNWALGVSIVALAIAAAQSIIPFFIQRDRAGESNQLHSIENIHGEYTGSLGPVAVVYDFRNDQSLSLIISSQTGGIIKFSGRWSWDGVAGLVTTTLTNPIGTADLTKLNLPDEWEDTLRIEGEEMICRRFGIRLKPKKD